MIKIYEAEDEFERNREEHAIDESTLNDDFILCNNGELFRYVGNDEVVTIPSNIKLIWEYAFNNYGLVDIPHKLGVCKAKKVIIDHPVKIVYHVHEAGLTLDNGNIRRLITRASKEGIDIEYKGKLYKGLGDAKSSNNTMNQIMRKYKLDENDLERIKDSGVEISDIPKVYKYLYDFCVTWNNLWVDGFEFIPTMGWRYEFSKEDYDFIEQIRKEYKWDVDYTDEYITDDGEIGGFSCWNDIPGTEMGTWGLDSVSDQLGKEYITFLYNN